MSRPNRVFFLVLAIYALSMRLLPFLLTQMGVITNFVVYPWNFSPMSAFCLFGAAYFTRKAWVFFIPLGLWLVGDLGIWAITNDLSMAFHKNSSTVYVSLLLITVIGLCLRNHRSLPKVLLAGFVGETLFFLITNMGVWYFFPTYAQTAGGLMDCYLAGLPFYRLALASTFFFLTVFFLPYLLKERKARVPASESSAVPTP